MYHKVSFILNKGGCFIRRKWICITSVVAVIMIGCIVCYLEYRNPISIQRSVVACSEHGNVVELDLDLYAYRFLFDPTEIRGTVVLNGTSYKSGGWNETMKRVPPTRIENVSLSERLWMKSKGQGYGLTFTALNPNGVANSLMDGVFLVFAYDDVMELHSGIFVTIQQDEIIKYCFPAETLEEYEDIYRKLGSVEE